MSTPANRPAVAGTKSENPLVRDLAPIRINLLPHRELKRERKKKDFVILAALVAIAGAVTAYGGGVAINQQISEQSDRNAFIKTETAKLDSQITDIAGLREEIAALKARQEAVENLQSDRTVPVHLFDELVRLAPEGLYLRQLKQEDRKISLTGLAQTNERVADLLKRLSESSPWLYKPELTEIKEIALSAGPGQKEGRSIFEFSLNVLIKPPVATESAAPGPGPRPASQTLAVEPTKVGSAQ
jgi:type IV pilus assembly protein PilN